MKRYFVDFAMGFTWVDTDATVVKSPQRSKGLERRQGHEHPPSLRRSAGP